MVGKTECFYVRAALEVGAITPAFFVAIRRNDTIEKRNASSPSKFNILQPRTIGTCT